MTTPSTCLLLAFLAVPAVASDLVEVLPLDASTLMLHWDDGRVIPHRRGEPRSGGSVIVDPLDVAAASLPSNYLVASKDDPAWRAGKRPARINRKSKGTEFAWFTDRWVDGVAVNDRPDHAKEHWVYLSLPAPMRVGKTYTVTFGGKRGSVLFDPTRTRSEAVHVNLIGYVPDAPEKFGYVSHWRGDGGSMPVDALIGKPFSIVPEVGGKAVFRGVLSLRGRKDRAETYHATDTPLANFGAADVLQADFSALTKPGRYRLAVDGVGASFPFTVGADVYREPFRVTARGLYHNRSGIELKAPFTEFTRPVTQNPTLTPAFCGKLQYTTVRMQEWGSEGGDAAKLRAGFKGPLEAWGWYQDAGDWDSYDSHLRVPTELLFAYEIAPANFSDGELNIPESGNSVPDLLDEAAWLPRFCHRLRQELLKKGWGTGGLGLRVAGDAFGDDTGPNGVGRGSWEDDRTYAASGEDPVSTIRYAGVAAMLARALRTAGKADPQGVDWEREARESYAWALANTRPGDEEAVRPQRAFAAAALFRLTGDATFVARLDADTAGLSGLVREQALYPAYLASLPGGESPTPAPLLARMRGLVLATADDEGIVTREKRNLRFGGDFGMPMLVGQQTTPWMLPTAIGWALTKTSDPAKARLYRAAVLTTADYFLGTNNLNATWVTGLGPRHPVGVFHMDAWYNGKPGPHPGIIPYGPWLKQGGEFGAGPWDAKWPNKTIYPAGIDNWPGSERWFDNRNSPLQGEFTIHQNTGPAAALFGILCAPSN